MTLKQLFEAAVSELSNLTTVQNPDFRLEQAEFNKDEKVWNVVVSYLVENTNPRIVKSPLASLAEFSFHRIYKLIKLDENLQFRGLFIFDNKA